MISILKIILVLNSAIAQRCLLKRQVLEGLCMRYGLIVEVLAFSLHYLLMALSSLSGIYDLLRLSERSLRYQ